MDITFENLPLAVSQLQNQLNNIERLLLDKSNDNPQESEQLLTIKQTSNLLNLSVPTLYSKVQRAEIPVCKRGKRLYFSKLDLMEWIKQGKRKTKADIESEVETYLVNKKKG
jgi:excisionase family DNA binding protein